MASSPYIAAAKPGGFISGLSPFQPKPILIKPGYQMWLTHNGEADKIRLPVHPSAVMIDDGSMNQSITVAGLGEIVIKQDRPAMQISFSSFFPANYFPGVQVGSLTSPEVLVSKIRDWKNSDKPVHFVITGTSINMYCTIENFSTEEHGGDVGTVHYSLVLKEYREVSVRQIEIKKEAQTASVPAETETRTDNRVQPKTYTVVSGDCLWNIAKRLLGDGSRYTEIYELNKDIVKNPDLIYPGQVLKLPG